MSVMDSRLQIINRYLYCSAACTDSSREGHVKEFYGNLIKCTACPIRQECSAPVSAVGNIDAEVMLVGRNPGKTEDSKGIPFIGKGGELLDQWITWVGFNRDDLLITNLVKCYTEDDRKPVPTEIGTCATNWLANEVSILNPKLIITFGAEASLWVAGVAGNVALADVRMKFWSVAPTHPVGHMRGRSFICCTHPGAPLRVSSQMKNFRDDAYFVRATVKSLIASRQLTIRISDKEDL